MPLKGRFTDKSADNIVGVRLENGAQEFHFFKNERKFAVIDTKGFGWIESFWIRREIKKAEFEFSIKRLDIHEIGSRHLKIEEMRIKPPEIEIRGEYV